MKKNILAALTVVFSISALFAQKNKMNDYKKTASGLEYMITYSPKQKGTQAQAGDIVSVHYTGKFLNDSVFDSSVARNEPIKFTLGKGQVIKGWDEGIALLHVGEKAKFVIPAELAYGDRQVGPIPANSKLIFDVELISITEKPKAYDVKGKDTVTTPSGLKYIKVQENAAGTLATNGKTVVVHYTGFLLDGSIFDSSVQNGNKFEFPLGAGRVIKGWDEGLALMKTGEKCRFIIPFNLAYGERGYPPIIPAKSDLIFDVELFELK
jgi:peptidylprolyl isomerase